MRNTCFRAALAMAVLFTPARTNLQAQDRLPPIAAENLSDAQKRGAEDFKKVRGTAPFGPFIPLLRSPDVMVRVGALGEQLRYKSSLAPRLSEFIILLIARQWTQQYEWHTHESIARQAGLRADIIEAVRDGRRPERMADDEEIVYSVLDELERNRTVSDVTYRRGAAKLGEQGIIDTTAIAGYYTLLAMVMNTAQTALPDGTTPPLRPLGH